MKATIKKKKKVFSIKGFNSEIPFLAILSKAVPVFITF